MGFTFFKGKYDQNILVFIKHLFTFKQLRNKIVVIVYIKNEENVIHDERLFILFRRNKQ